MPREENNRDLERGYSVPTNIKEAHQAIRRGPASFDKMMEEETRRAAEAARRRKKK